MQTPTRPALMGKSPPDLVHMLRLMGADSRAGETKESIINRILMFQKQKWEPEVKIERKPVVPVVESELHNALAPYIQRGLKLKIKDGSWFITIEKRKDSGTLSMPLEAIVRCAKYLMPKGI